MAFEARDIALVRKSLSLLHSFKRSMFTYRHTVILVAVEEKFIAYLR
jgi:hypothetical protein